MIKKLKLLILFNALLFPFYSCAEQPSLNFHIAHGVGAKYAGFSFPFPLLNINFSKNNSTIFTEIAASPVIFSINLGYEHKISHHVSAYVARVEGDIKIGNINLSGYKFGYTYNLNAYNEQGWETSIELYSVENKVFPAVSFGFHW